MNLTKAFFNGFREKMSGRRRLIGIECEFPVVTYHGDAISHSIIQGLYRYLRTKGFTLGDEKNGLRFEVTRHNHLTPHKEYVTDIITTDTGCCTLEIALAPQDNLHTVHTQLLEILAILNAYFREHQCRLLGYGIQPITSPSKQLLTPRERYYFFSRFSSNQLVPHDDGRDSDLLNITAANQCHLEISRREAIMGANVLNALAGPQAALSANSPIWKNAVGTHKVHRELFWQYIFSDASYAVGMSPFFETPEAYIEHWLQFKPRLVFRDNQYYQVMNKTTAHAFFDNQTPTLGKSLDGHTCEIEPRITDLHDFNRFCYFNARLVPKFGTIENRIFCQQPPRETLTSAALTLGIIENLAEAAELVNQYSWDRWNVWREQAIHGAFESGIKQHVFVDLLAIAWKGLQKRQLGEEVYLEPFTHRLKQRQSPADVATYLFEQGGVMALLDYYTIT